LSRKKVRKQKSKSKFDLKKEAYTIEKWHGLERVQPVPYATPEVILVP